MDNFFQLLIKSNTINFIIVLALIVYLCIKLNIKQKTETIRDEIKLYVQESEQEKIQAEKELSEIKDQLTTLPAETEYIEKSAENSIQSIGKKIQSEIESQKQDIENNAKRLLSLETKKFQSKLTDLLCEKSIEIAKENAKNQLNSNENLHRKYIDNAINELDRITL